MGRGSGDKGKKAFAHVNSRQHRARRLRTLQEVVSGELGAEYLVRHLPDTGHIVLTPVDGGGEWCSTQCTIHVGEDRRSGVAHPIAALNRKRGAFWHFMSKNIYCNQSALHRILWHHASSHITLASTPMWKRT